MPSLSKFVMGYSPVKTRPSATTVFCVCFTVLMDWINPLIAVSLKTRLPEGYCNACARWARFFVATGVVFALTLGPAIAACSYILFLLYKKKKNPTS